ncbi:MAG: CRISPR-associated helicase Cas3' [Lachnospiraceae bacterium]|nr:CRISPR-associated helicase Cas3' [Lachnospiraceae bacterium]
MCWKKLPEALLFFAGKTDGKMRNSAKWLPVWMHLEDTAGVMEVLARNRVPVLTQRAVGFEDEDEFCSYCRLLGYLHDIGKFTPSFAAAINECFPDRAEEMHFLPRIAELPSHSCTSHALAGQVILRDCLNYPVEVAEIIGAHHGKPFSYQQYKNQLEVYRPNYFGPKARANEKFFREIWRSWADYALAATGFKDAGSIPHTDIRGQVLMTGLLIEADWIASNTGYFPLVELDYEGDIALYPERVDNAMKRLNLPEMWKPLYFSMNADKFKECYKFSANAVQERIMEISGTCSEPGIYILEAPMGSGKTEAALAAAEILASRFQCGGLFFGLPTQATANGIFGRLLEWAKERSEDAVHAVRLSHGMAELNEDYRELYSGKGNVGEIDDSESGVIVHQWFGGRKTGLLSDFVIGTVDQVLLSALKQKHVMLRHLGLSGKVVIIDECHAYDSYMNQYLDRALNWLGAYGVPVIMLSATLPSERRAEIVYAYQNVSKRAIKKRGREEWAKCASYPLITWSEGTEIHSEAVTMSYGKKGMGREVCLDTISFEEIAAKLREKLREGGSAGIILNTVKRVQDCTEWLKTELFDMGLEFIIIHAQFVATERARIERKLLSKIGKNSTESTRNRVVVIGTQVLEQSLDIDFDYLISDLCPMDLLLQRMGRLHRHVRKRPGPMSDASCSVILNEDGTLDSGSVKIYGEWLLKRTKELLPRSIIMPEDISILVQKTYSDPREEEFPLPAGKEGFAVSGGDASFEEYRNRKEDQRKRAKRYCISPPLDGNKYAGWLEAYQEGNEASILASVRDGDISIEVLLMKCRDDGKIGFVGGDGSFEYNHVPDEDSCREIARQRLRLPHIFCYYLKQALEELEYVNEEKLSEWQQSKWLYGELVLLLDTKGYAYLAGFELEYSSDRGLITRKMEG